MSKSFRLICALLCIGFFTSAQGIKPQSSKVSFELSNLMINTVEGSFTEIEGRVNLNPESPEKSLIFVCVKSSSINTANEKRDEHLRAEDFFAADKFPNICFVGEGFTYLGNNEWEVQGVFEIKGQKKQISLKIKDLKGQLTCSFVIDRLDYGIGQDYSTFTIGQEVTLSVNLQH